MIIIKKRKVNQKVSLILILIKKQKSELDQSISIIIEYVNGIKLYKILQI